MQPCCWWILLFSCFPGSITHDFNETLGSGTTLVPDGLIASWRVLPHNEIWGWGWRGHMSGMCAQVWILKKGSCKLFRESLHLGWAVKFQQGLKTRLKTQAMSLRLSVSGWDVSVSLFFFRSVQNHVWVVNKQPKIKHKFFRCLLLQISFK